MDYSSDRKLLGNLWLLKEANAEKKLQLVELILVITVKQSVDMQDISD